MVSSSMTCMYILPSLHFLSPPIPHTLLKYSPHTLSHTLSQHTLPTHPNTPQYTPCGFSNIATSSSSPAHPNTCASDCTPFSNTSTYDQSIATASCAQGEGGGALACDVLGGGEVGCCNALGGGAICCDESGPGALGGDEVGCDALAPGCAHAAATLACTASLVSCVGVDV